MSMNEFERPGKSAEQEPLFCSLQQDNRPCDFSEDDFAFAEELNALFSPEIEALPPYYVPTLLDSSDQCFEPVGRGFEYRTKVHVFRRLKLRRRLFNTRSSPFSALSVDYAPTRRPLLMLAATFLCVMLLTVAFTGSSFASGVGLLLRGSSNGRIYQFPHSPLGLVQSPANSGQGVYVSPDEELSLLAAQQHMSFPIYLSQDPSYFLHQINLYVDLNQQWSDGPVLEFEYDVSLSPDTPQRTAKIWVREFKPKANVDVLQLVTASALKQEDDEGQAGAIYVDGQWETRGENPPVWVSDQRSELVYQLNGVIFWIAGDQRDGIDKNQLVRISQGLASGTSSPQYRMMEAGVSVKQLDKDALDSFLNDVIVVLPKNNSYDPYYVSVSSYDRSQRE